MTSSETVRRGTGLVRVGEAARVLLVADVDAELRSGRLGGELEVRR
ncbi:hypothetical protein ACWCW7_10290 [Nocardia tengchongensis]